MANKETLSSSITETTVANFDTRLDALATEAASLVSSVSGMKMVVSIKMTVTGGSVSSVVYTATWDVYDDTLAKILLINAQITGALTAVEGAANYTTVTAVTGQVTFVVTE